jgi:hypothetical protein
MGRIGGREAGPLAALIGISLVAGIAALLVVGDPPSIDREAGSLAAPPSESELQAEVGEPSDPPPDASPIEETDSGAGDGGSEQPPPLPRPNPLKDPVGEPPPPTDPPPEPEEPPSPLPLPKLPALPDVPIPLPLPAALR